MSEQRILITGGGGFFGRNLKEQLAGHRISAPSHAELDLLDADAVSGYLERGRFDVVLHAATENATRTATRDVTRVMPFNCRMFFNLARALDRGAFGKLIYFGSGAEYDRLHWRPQMEESYFDVHVPADDYGLSKYVMTKYAERAKNIVNLRCFGVFGKYEDWRIRFISHACCRALFDLPVTIRQNVFFDYLSVDDLVAITRWFVENDAPQPVYNVCTGKAVDLRTLAGKVLAAAGKQLEVQVASPGLGNEYSGDNARLLALLGGYRFADPDRSIEQLYRWYESRKSEIDKSQL